MLKHLTFSIILSFMLLFYIQQSHASAFTNAYVRFDRLKANTATTGLICATPASSGTENNLQVTFPSGFTVSPTLSNWSVNTSDIPSGTTPWPGIGAATVVASQTVTFPSDDLTAGTQYCFNWTNSNAVTTGPIGSTQGTLTTRTLLGGTIDSSIYYLTIKSNDQVSVTATVPVHASDADVTLSATPSTSATLAPGDTVAITVGYRSLLSSSEQFKIEAYWEEGLIEGTTSNYVEVFDYIIGSATPTETGISPIVDLNNRRITWDIPSLTPSSAFKTVTFKLKIASSLPTTNHIAAAIKARGRIITTYASEASMNYTIQQAILPSSTPGPTITPTPSSDTTSTPRFPQLISVSVDNITKHTANISFRTDIRSNFILTYGTSPAELNQRIISKSPGLRQSAMLTDLIPATRYYFQIQIRDDHNQKIKSDIFTFETAEEDTAFVVKSSDIILSSRDIILNTAAGQNIVIPPSHPLSISVRLSQPEDIQTLRIIFKNDEVLGINNIAPLPPVKQTELIEVLPGLFSAKLLSPQDKGTYYLQLSTQDVYGGIYNQRLPYTIHTVEPITVKDTQTKQPIENAEVKIFKYEDSLKRYSLFDERFSLSYHTDEKGKLNIALPQGKYIFEVTADGYSRLKETTELAISDNQYPTVYMNPTHTIKDTISYFVNNGAVVKRFVTLSLWNYFISKVARDISIAIALCMILFSALVVMRTIESPSLLRRTPFFYFKESFYTYSITSFSVVCILLSAGFIYVQGLSPGLPVLFVTIVQTGLTVIHIAKLRQELFT